MRKYFHGFNAYNINIDGFKNVLLYINKLFEFMCALVLNDVEMLDYIQNKLTSGSSITEEKRFLDFVKLYYSKDSSIYKFVVDGEAE